MSDELSTGDIITVMIMIFIFSTIGLGFYDCNYSRPQRQQEWDATHRLCPRCGAPNIPNWVTRCNKCLSDIPAKEEKQK